MTMASREQHDDALLWVKLHELEVQLAAYKLLLRREEEVGAAWDSCCRRGRQYDAYMRRREERRAAKKQLLGGGTTTLTTGTSSVSIPTTAGKEHGALARSRTVSGGTARPQHQRRNSFAGGSSIPAADLLADTPRPFLRRGSGTGGAAASRPSSSSTRKRWGSPETPPPAMFAADPQHTDFAKGALRKLLSFVTTKSKMDGPFDRRASMEQRQFPMARVVGTSI